MENFATAIRSIASDQNELRRERFLKVLSAATFLIFFQAYMVAPLIPRLSAVFGISAQQIGLVVPAYLIPYGVSTLVYGVLSDRIGRRSIMFASLAAFIILTGLTATANSAGQLMFWRLLTGIGASGVVPLALASMGTLFPYEQRGRPLGWLFGAMAGGAAFGATVGVMLESVIGWRLLFLGVAIAATVVLVFLLPYRSLLAGPTPGPHASLREVFAGYRSLLGDRRGFRTYAYVFWNAIFHSGVYTWLGVYFARHYGLNDFGIGLAVLGYGVPGFLLGPLVGRAADRWGRIWLIPAGIGIAALAAAVLIGSLPIVVATLAITVLSLGYDMTQPLLAGIVTSLDKKRAGQAMGLNVFLLFTGSGVGSYLFGEALRLGFGTALAMFAVAQFLAAVIAVRLFHSEKTISGKQ
jgi:predicted MFS family arabinose efflux permease